MRLGINGRFYGARPTGVQRFARDLSAHLYSRQEVTLFLPGTLARPPEVPDHVPVVHGRLPGHAWEQAELPWHVGRQECDVMLHLSGTAPRWGGPNVVVVYDLSPLTHPEFFTPAFRLWFRLALARSARGAAEIIAISEWTREEVARVLRIPRSRIHVVSQGLDPFREPAPAAAVERVRRRWALPERFMLGLGGRSRRKNLGFLLGMVARWQSRQADPPCLVLTGAEYSHIDAKARLDLRGRTDVRLLGYVDDAELQALYTAASVFCFPSLAEGFGRPPLEAMACGTPAVVGEYGCAREVLGDAGIILPLHVDRWIDAISPLLEGGPERECRVAKGREHTTRFQWEMAAAELLEVCRYAATKKSTVYQCALP